MLLSIITGFGYNGRDCLIDWWLGLEACRKDRKCGKLIVHVVPMLFPESEEGGIGHRMVGRIIFLIQVVVTEKLPD